MNYFAENEYLIRKKFFKIFGDAFHVHDSHGRVVAYSRLKAFRLKEDVRIYTGEDMTQEIFRISARSVIDFSAGYDVTDSKTGERIGVLKRKGFKSIFRDEWIVFDKSETEIGIIQEDSAMMAFLRRFLSDLIPQSFECFCYGEKACSFDQQFNLLILKVKIRFQKNVQVDRRLLMAAGTLLCAIEKQ
ncbi:MAG: hypothetical protein KC931_25035 [Candidatus Omnitrophica bacterium]|nr:hypothetical protein [Candidatus Omnitrophota bacterium]